METNNESSKVCDCGHGIDHPVVVIKNKYDWKGWILLMTGITTHPVKGIYHCTLCDKDFDETIDPAILNKYIN